MQFNVTLKSCYLRFKALAKVKLMQIQQIERCKRQDNDTHVGKLCI